MDVEVRKAPTPYRTQMMTRLRGYKREIDQLSRELVNTIVFSPHTPHNAPLIKYSFYNQITKHTILHGV